MNHIKTFEKFGVFGWFRKKIHKDEDIGNEVYNFVKAKHIDFNYQEYANTQSFQFEIDEYSIKIEKENITVHRGTEISLPTSEVSHKLLLNNDIVNCSKYIKAKIFNRLLWLKELEDNENKWSFRSDRMI